MPNKIHVYLCRNRLLDEITQRITQRKTQRSVASFSLTTQFCGSTNSSNFVIKLKS